MIPDKAELQHAFDRIMTWQRYHTSSNLYNALQKYLLQKAIFGNQKHPLNLFQLIKCGPRGVFHWQCYQCAAR